MEKLKRGDKIYLDKEGLRESCINAFLEARDATIKCFEYHDASGYGSRTRLFYCSNHKRESKAIIRQIEVGKDIWVEEELRFDSDSFVFLRALIIGQEEELGGKFTLVRDC